jgi:hypothetical protein
MAKILAFADDGIGLVFETDAARPSASINTASNLDPIVNCALGRRDISLTPVFPRQVT